MSQGPPSSGSTSPSAGGGGYRPQYVEQVFFLFFNVLSINYLKNTFLYNIRSYYGSKHQLFNTNFFTSIFNDFQ